MKRYLLYISMLLGVIGLVACSENESTYPVPTPLLQESIKAEAHPGFIVLHWEVPADSNYYYVKIEYTLPESGKKCTRLASVYSDSVVVTNLLARYGDIEFTLQPFSKDGQGGQISKITQTSKPAPKQVLINGKKEAVALALGQVSVNSLEKGDGSLAALVDGNKSTFYHGCWSSPVPLPHYFVLDLKKPVYAVEFSYITRDHNNKCNPKTLEIYGSNTFGGVWGDVCSTELFDISKATLLTTISGLPADKGASYSSGAIKAEDSFRYLWLRMTAVTTGASYTALSELAVNELKTSVSDPETGETTEN